MTERRLTLAVSFAGGDVTAVRHEVSRHAADAGLNGQRLDDFVLAVNEVVTNAVRHGGGSGHLRLFVQSGSVCCEVSDEGHGIPPERLNDRQRPSALATGGRGLWLARRLCDHLAVRTGSLGTTVYIGIGVGAGRIRPNGWPTSADGGDDGRQRNSGAVNHPVRRH